MVAYNVPLIPQTTNMGCWAASIAMILGWKEQASFDPTRIAANPGGLNYMPSLVNGLDPNDSYILEQNGFSLERPMCYTRERIEGLLTDYGPLWVAGAVPTPHIRVVTGLDGGQVLVNDPAPVSVGKRYRRHIESFFGQMETLGRQELAHPTPVYVAHLR
jgi:hypothetical protein